MIRSAVLVSGKGTKLQSLLDSVFFGEIPELQLVAVISSDANAYALKRARNAGIETVVVEPAMFPNDTSYDMAIRNKLKDMDIELVINAGFYPGVGRETAKSFRNKVIAVQPSLVPAFETLRGDAVHEAVLARGLKVTGATAYLVDETGGVGPVLLQKAVPVLEDDDVTTLKRRVLTEAEWKLLRSIPSASGLPALKLPSGWQLRMSAVLPLLPTGKKLLTPPDTYWMCFN